MRRLLRTACLTLPLLVLAFPVVHASNVDLFFAAGADFPRLYNRTPVMLNSIQTNDYAATRKSQTKFIGGAGFGHTFSNIGFSPLDISIGVAGYYNDFGYVKGTEYPFVNMGGFDKLNYRFDAASYTVMGEARLTYSDSIFHPYLMGGAGNAWNRLSNFRETPISASGSAVPVPATFPNKTKSEFAYEAGAGIQYILPYSNSYTAMPVYYSIDLGYRYLDLGKGELGGLPSQTSSERLTVFHMRTQAVLLALQASI
jgi:opacity protein-like surface antigen